MHEVGETCQTCFITSEFPGVEIDSSGRCQFCRSGTFHKTPTDTLVYKPDALMQCADQIKQARNGGKYDCIIGVSGGLDSTYVVYITKKLMGLNPLLVHYDHGLFYEQGKENLENLSRSLNVDLRHITSKNDWDKKYIKAILKAFSKSKLYWGICFFCHYILPASVAKTATKENITYLMDSSNDYEVALHVPRATKIRAMAKALFSAGLHHIPGMIFQFIRAQYYLLRLKIEFYIPPLTNLFKRGPKSSLKKINLTEFVPWNIGQMKQLLSEEVGWKSPSHPNLGMRFDCMIEDSFINLTYKNATGATIHSIIANNLIYDGQQKKDQLEEVIDHYNHIIDERTSEVKRVLNLDK